MFQKRLRNFLIVLLVATAVLLLRALQLQVFGREEWTERAAKVFAPPAQLIETVRGRILDVRGKEVAVDSPCVDLCVDYRAIVAADRPAEERVKDKWLRGVAGERLKERMGDSYPSGRGERGRLIDEEVPRVVADIDKMWGVIARMSKRTREEIEETRRGIVQRVEMRRRYVWVSRWREAMADQKALPDAPWYQRWLLGEGENELSLDSFDLTVGEQTAAHVVLADVPEDVRNFFGKNPEAYPGLVLRPGIKRVYPFGEAGCHLIGRLGKVTREDLLSDDDSDELRKYWPNDLIGRSGVEALAENVLRGSRGKVVRRGDAEESAEPKHGRDVFLTVDIELQREIQRLFKHVALSEGEGKGVSYHEMHGAAVVIDVETGDVRAMASYPDYDLNKYDEDYNKLRDDTLGAPLLNRATQVSREPGSTAKPMIGLGAITQGIIKPTDTIECTGYLVLGGHRYSVARCWVASKYANDPRHPPIAHHQIPYSAPHPTGFLTFADALERSCNVFFETLGDKLGLEGESHWFREFGLGRPTGIGIAEVSGYVPEDTRIIPNERRSAAWMSAIGQSKVAATPIQMANVAATIARDGVWKKPRLVIEGTPLPKPKPSTMPAERRAREEDTVDLHLSPAGVRAAKLGMYNVVNAPAGTGKAIVQLEGTERVDPALAHMRIAGKTGTAQASPVKVPVEDEWGDVVRDENGKPVLRYLKAGIHGGAPGEVDWYHATDDQGKKFNHAWFMGFAPADKPRVAFAVLVEYGESGGGTAGRVAKHVVEACVRHGYLPAGGDK